MLPDLIQKYGKKALIITGASSLSSSLPWQELQQKMEAMGINRTVFSVVKEPSPQVVDACVEKFKSSDIQVVIAIGGGSVLDAGKAVSAMLPLGEPVKLYLEGVGRKVHHGSKVPFVAVPTTSGTGSETTKNAVISEIGPHGFKKSLRHDNFVPDIAIVDPQLTISCSSFITAISGMDAFTQLLESYLSSLANPMTDALALEGLRNIKNSLIPAFENGENLEARSGMALASMLSGSTLANAGLGTVHGFASPIGGYFDIPHGVVCSVLMGPVNRLTVKKLRRTGSGEQALKKYAVAGSLFSEKGKCSDDYYIDYLLNLIEEYSTRMNIPKLSAYGISKNDFEKIIRDTDNKYNPVKLNLEELEAALEMAL